VCQDARGAPHGCDGGVSVAVSPSDARGRQGAHRSTCPMVWWLPLRATWSWAPGARVRPCPGAPRPAGAGRSGDGAAPRTPAPARGPRRSGAPAARRPAPPGRAAPAAGRCPRTPDRGRRSPEDWRGARVRACASARCAPSGAAGSRRRGPLVCQGILPPWVDGDQGPHGGAGPRPPRGGDQLADLRLRRREAVPDASFGDMGFRVVEPLSLDITGVPGLWPLHALLLGVSIEWAPRRPDPVASGESPTAWPVPAPILPTRP
jgi:hypothetical protein